MSADDPDWNLLLGLLGLQIGLFDQGQLVAAFQAWTRQRSGTLAEHLIERGALDPEGRAVLEALVSDHLRRHRGDGERSLAAVPADRSVRAVLIALVDPERAPAPVVSDSGPTGPSDDLEPTATYARPEDAGSGVQRFLVLRPHARGGLGEVHVALDRELRREVALKQIQKRYADDPSARRRFTLEAEVTGGLEHPNIVPVYGLGRHSDGRPYYAMRFIQGESLKEAIAEFHADERWKREPGRRSLALRKLLRRFLDVCNAIDYAHSRGMLHRDLKPANVMLGKHGETIVVDWGLAKPMGRHDSASWDERMLMAASAEGSDSTLPGSAIGTPAYMSPEQARGEVDRLGPRSDVYSLGATLYCLLTGHPLFEGEEADVLRAAQGGRVRSPRMHDPTIDPALEAICLKALALEPAGRYASPRALADDLEHWLADEPVDAWPEPALRRIARWARRHRTAVAASLGLLLATLAALAAGTILLERANSRIERERDLARANFRLARSAVDDYLTRVGQSPVLKDRGLHDLRRELLDAALGYYQTFLSQRADDPGLGVEATAARRRVGDIQSELGNFDEAVQTYDQVLDLARSLPEGAETAALRLQSEAARITALTALNRYDEAITAFHRASAAYSLREPPAELGTHVIRLFNAGADACTNAGRAPEGLRASVRALELGEAQALREPDDLGTQRELLVAYTYATRKLNFAARVDEAVSVCQRGIDRGEAALRAHPRDLDLIVGLADLLHQLAIIEMSNGRPESALGYSQRCVQLVEAASNENPRLFRPRQFLIESLSFLSSVQTEVKLIDESLASAGRAAAYAEALVVQEHDAQSVQFLLGESLLFLGRSLYWAGRVAEAVPHLHRSASLLGASREPIHVYNAACGLAMASTIDDPGETESSGDRRARDADAAAALLRRAVEYGLNDLGLLQNDRDIASLRTRSDVQALIRDVESRVGSFPRTNGKPESR